MIFSSIVAFGLAAFLHLESVAAAPVAEEYPTLGPKAVEILERATPAAPHFFVYADAWVPDQNGPPPVSDVEGFNVFAVSFLLIEGAWDQAETWTELDASDRSTILSEYEAAGIQMVVAFFGSDDEPTTSGEDPTTLATTMANWVVEYGFAGADVDYEDFTAMDEGTAEAWLITFTQQLRTILPTGDYILTHAPVAPWFSASMYAAGGYLTVDSAVGDLIDWYNVQFYNQGATEYTDCEGLLYESSSANPNSALFQISASGISLDKLVIGKPAGTGDANSGYMDPSTLASCVAEAQSGGWTAGVSTWEYPDATASWISTVRASSWPV